MNRALRLSLGAVVATALFARAASAGNESQVWSGYLDYAYVYSSADAKSLGERLNGYGKEAGVPLDRYLADYFGTLGPQEGTDAENQIRRKAIAELLLYLQKGSVDSLEASGGTEVAYRSIYGGPSTDAGGAAFEKAKRCGTGM